MGFFARNFTEKWRGGPISATAIHSEPSSDTIQKADGHFLLFFLPQNSKNGNSHLAEIDHFSLSGSIKKPNIRLF